MAGLEELGLSVDTMIVIPNQNLFHMSTAETSLMDAFRYLKTNDCIYCLTHIT